MLNFVELSYQYECYLFVSYTNIYKLHLIYKYNFFIFSKLYKDGMELNINYHFLRLD